MGALNFVRTGPEGAPVVVLIHAVGYDLTYWDRQIEALSSEYSVVAFDLPGHGLSAGGPEDYASFERVSEAVSALIEVIQGPLRAKNEPLRPVHLVGISFGSMVAQAVVLARPELVRSLTLIGTAATFPEAVRAGMRARAETVRREGMGAVLATISTGGLCRRRGCGGRT